MDYIGCQINYEVGKVIATKGDKDFHSLTLSKRVWNVSIVARINADGYIISPALIFKGVRQNSAFSNGLPLESKIY